jgi:hypothetical protein
MFDCPDSMSSLARVLSLPFGEKSIRFSEPALNEWIARGGAPLSNGAADGEEREVA